MGPDQTYSRYTALVANDDMFQLTIITHVMQMCGFEVYTAENGYILNN